MSAPAASRRALSTLPGVVLARKDEHLAGLGRRHGKEPAGFARGDAGNQLRLPEAFAGAAVGTQQGKFAPGQQVRDQPSTFCRGTSASTPGPTGVCSARILSFSRLASALAAVRKASRSVSMAS